jgi:hypothetical protein
VRQWRDVMEAFLGSVAESQLGPELKADRSGDVGRMWQGHSAAVVRSCYATERTEFRSIPVVVVPSSFIVAKAWHRETKIDRGFLLFKGKKFLLNHEPLNKQQPNVGSIISNPAKTIGTVKMEQQLGQVGAPPPHAYRATLLLAPNCNKPWEYWLAIRKCHDIFEPTSNDC